MQRRRTKNKAVFFWMTCLLLAGTSAGAAPSSPTVSNSTVCAVLEEFLGHVEIFSQDRTKILNPDANSPIDCGSWLAVDVGWAKVKHRDGHRIQVGRNSFVRFAENNPDGRFSGDHVVIFRGNVYGETGAGSSELRMITTNARARIQAGAGVVLYNDKADETQLLVLENRGEIENRFASEKKVALRAGEASTLNFKLMRVVPSSPRAISVSHLRPVLVDLHLSQRDQEYAVKSAHKRMNRQFSSIFVQAAGDAPSDQAGSEALKKEKRKYTYLRHRPSKKDTALQSHWMSKIVGGDPRAESLIVSEATKIRRPSGSMDMDVERSGKSNRTGRYKANEEGEKQRLMDELSQVMQDE